MTSSMLKSILILQNTLSSINIIRNHKKSLLDNWNISIHGILHQWYSQNVFKHQPSLQIDKRENKNEWMRKTMIMTILFRPQKGPQLEFHAERVLVVIWCYKSRRVMWHVCVSSFMTFDRVIWRVWIVLFSSKLIDSIKTYQHQRRIWKYVWSSLHLL